MRGLHNTILILVALVATMLLSMAVSAEVSPVAFTVESDAVTDKILEDGVATFRITINNLQDTSDTFRFLPLEDVHWTPQFVPIYDKVNTISGEGVKTTTVLLKPSGVPKGTYNVKLTAESENTKTRYNTIMRIYVGPHPSMYEPDLGVTARVPAKLDPHQDYDIKITLTNKNIINLGNVHVSTIGKFVNNEQDVIIGPEEEKIVSVALHIPEDIEPQTDEVKIKVTYGDEVFYDDTHSMEVLEYLPPFTQNVEVKRSFLKTTKKIVLTNDGNTEKTSPVKLETTRRLNLFTSSDPKAETVEENGRLYNVWQVSLEPEETITITVKTSYRWLVSLIILGILIYIIYLVMKAPIVVTKSYKNIQYDEGTISTAKIVMHVKNRTNKPVKHVHIVDRIPSVVGVKKGSFKHTLEPKKAYKHGKEGTILEYEIPTLAPKEERIITYSIKSKIQIIGGLTLKPTIVKYKGKSGHIEKAFSEEVTLPGNE